ncbi:MAG: bacillithiol system redox-active protein YtxJ [Planctomycetota bacterium]
MSGSIRAVQSSEDFQSLLAESETRPVMLLKHSTRCPISSFANAAFEDYATAAASRDIELARVLVVEDRPVSLEIASTLGVVHQSPQAILLHGKQAVWDDSHGGITVDALEGAESAVRSGS